MKALKKRNWLVETEDFRNKNPKEYYKEAIKEIIEEINNNIQSIKNVLICNNCKEIHTDYAYFCQNCGVKL
ncbi:MAG: hypothetical protein ACFE85_03810 [Candidatus Hodarchaeota archaeon]